MISYNKRITAGYYYLRSTKELDRGSRCPPSNIIALVELGDPTNHIPPDQQKWIDTTAKFHHPIRNLWTLNKFLFFDTPRGAHFIFTINPKLVRRLNKRLQIGLCKTVHSAATSSNDTPTQ